ncbi:mRNA interferase toxin YafQ [Commensalibacter sp. Nvir]|uniref:type II toxin-antitoxin system YafQ family toxin n=1 Tax=Commensalibacter sp. Nvir TaxID=3069817 RepID=UPI002D55CAA2|nr:mRNA interferase toxin YafQ [Commensalibacter sp. Nvir]
MRTIKQTGQFKRDLKREKKGRYRTVLQSSFAAMVTHLANDKDLELRHVDHALAGTWKGFRNCHVKPDLILIYEKPDLETLVLVRLGSHAELELS